MLLKGYVGLVAVVLTMHTRDRKWRVYVHEDHTAELCDAQGAIVLGRVPWHQVRDRLVEEGVEADDLVQE